MRIVTQNDGKNGFAGANLKILSDTSTSMAVDRQTNF
jgi:hypothetical protein